MINSRQARAMLNKHNLTIQQFNESGIPGRFITTRDGTFYNRSLVEKFIKQHEENFPLIEGEMFEDWG